MRMKLILIETKQKAHRILLQTSNNTVKTSINTLLILQFIETHIHALNPKTQPRRRRRKQQENKYFYFDWIAATFFLFRDCNKIIYDFIRQGNVVYSKAIFTLNRNSAFLVCLFVHSTKRNFILITIISNEYMVTDAFLFKFFNLKCCCYLAVCRCWRHSFAILLFWIVFFFFSSFLERENWNWRNGKPAIKKIIGKAFFFFELTKQLLVSHSVSVVLYHSYPHNISVCLILLFGLRLTEHFSQMSIISSIIQLKSINFFVRVHCIFCTISPEVTLVLIFHTDYSFFFFIFFKFQ